MSESTDTVAAAFDALVAAMKDRAFDPASGATELGRIVGYMQAVGPLADNWKASLPVSGKVVGKRGRKPKSETAGTTEAGADAALTETQVETDAAPTGRSRRANA